MKQIVAVIQPHLLSKVEHALYQLSHFPGFTVLRAQGQGRGRASGHAYRPSSWDWDEHDKAMLTIWCADELSAQIIETIRRSAHTGLPGDGIIAVSSLEDVVRIGTDEHGDAAV